jgi:hypothetical protein
MKAFFGISAALRCVFFLLPFLLLRSLAQAQPSLREKHGAEMTNYEK